MENLERIDSARISVIIQGPTLYDSDGSNSAFHRCIESIRRVLPDAEIIVSTWKGQSCDENIINKIIFNEEPIAMNNSVHQAWNFNKMVISTLNGLKLASREYALKFRADLFLTNADFMIRSFEKIDMVGDDRKFFSDRIVISNIFTRDPAAGAPLLFHPSDLAQFGRTSDLLNLWNRSYVDRSGISIQSGLLKIFGFLSYTGLRMVPEQALMVGWLNSHGYQISLPYPGYVSRQYVKTSEITLSANFYLIDWRASGISFPDRFTKKKASTQTIYAAHFFNNLHHLHGDPSKSRRRSNQVVCSAYITRIFTKYFWVDLFVAPIAIISPSAFLRLQKRWRTMRGKA